MCIIICAIDIETSGLIIGQSRILEIACLLADDDEKEIFYRYSALVWDSAYPDPEPEAMAVNGLKLSALKSRGLSPVYVFPKVKRLIEQADCIIAHNGATFDIPLATFEFEQFGIEFPKKPLIDTRTDLPYPKSMGSRRLSHLVVDHDLLMPTKHRALADCEAMLSIAFKYDLKEALERCKSPLIRIEAQIAYKDNFEVKNRRYMWDPTKKVWWKNIRECDFEKECDSSPFVIFNCENDKRKKVP